MSIDSLQTQYGTNLTSKLMDGIQTFIKLTALQQDDKYVKWCTDEFDVFDKILIVKSTINTLTPIKQGCLMNRKTNYSYIEDLTKEINAVIFGDTKPQQIIQHKRFGSLYNLIIVPMIEMLSTINDNFIDNGTVLCDEVIDVISTHPFDIGDIEQAYMLSKMMQSKFATKPRKHYDDLLVEIAVDLEHTELDFN